MSDSYTTKDISLAAAIITAGHKIISLEKEPLKNNYLFVFETSEDLLSVVDKYWNNGLLLNVREYSTNLKYLKSRLYAVGAL